jgi:hypothetical protein
MHKLVVAKSRLTEDSISWLTIFISNITFYFKFILMYIPNTNLLSPSQHYGLVSLVFMSFTWQRNGHCLSCDDKSQLTTCLILVKGFSGLTQWQKLMVAEQKYIKYNSAWARMGSVHSVYVCVLIITMTKTVECKGKSETFRFF